MRTMKFNMRVTIESIDLPIEFRETYKVARSSLDLQVLKTVGLPGRWEKYQANLEPKVFNLTNSFNPRDLQNNLRVLTSALFKRGRSKVRHAHIFLKEISQAEGLSESMSKCIESYPLYDSLQPVADAITRAAQPQYNHQLNFYLVHESQPNAVAAAGSNLFVTDSLLYFVRITDELAVTLCHEVAHTIHHDTVTLIKKRKIAAGLILGSTRTHILALTFLGHLHSLRYSRDVEEQADLTSSEICAETRYNPWGLVWLLKDFENSSIGEVPELLSDHPNDKHRIDSFEKQFQKEASVFAKFDPDPRSAAQFSVPEKAA
jgi:Zn-dependent protease with chaperone function